ncbi:MAG TPA: class I SAM-dependent methyltransferase [Gaiellaceae bacterium]|jgi:hypothetical protein
MSAPETLLEEPGTKAAYACRSCGSLATSVFYEQEDVPVHSCRLVPTQEAALTFPRGTLRLAFCADCGFIANTAFDGSHQDYSVAYEETQGFSPRFRTFAHELAARWVERYHLRGKRIIEIGCGKGEFLATMCELGDNDGVGIDPAFVEERLPAHGAGRLSFFAELYDGEWGPLDADAVVCRHTVEHIAPVRAFLGDIRRGIGDRTETVVLFDLPDVVRVLREAAFWDLYYEHCSYFSPGSMARLFRRSGFDVLDLALDYDDQYIVLEARPAAGAPSGPHPAEESVEALRETVDAFAATLAATSTRWRDELRGLRAEGGRAVVWGAGSKAVGFLTTLGVGPEVEVAVDINPFKQDMFIAGTGHRVVAPEELVGVRPDLVVAMNPIYVDEIREQLAGLGLSPRVVGV